MRRLAMVVLATAAVIALGFTGGDDTRKKEPRKPAAGRPPSRIEDAAARPASRTWIGVRLSPVPESLQAHLGRGGLMVANVAKDSPAEAAGVERYDVVLSIDGREVGSMDALSKAVAEIGSERTVDLVVLRGARKHSLSIQPAERPTGTVNFKFEEPLADADPDVQYFGHRFQRDGLGKWMLEPLGNLPGMPDDVKDMLEDLGNPAWGGMLDRWKDFQANPGPFSLRMQNDPDDPSAFLFFYPDEPEEGAQVEIRISRTLNGEKITIERAADGSVAVERIDADGQRRSARYDSLDAFREGDADGYKVYRQFSGFRSRPMITLPPAWKNLNEKQQDFQQQMQDLLERTREQTRRALEHADRARESVRMHRHESRSDDDGHSSSESVTLSVSGDGVIELRIRKDGDTRTYKFDSREAFEKQEPALYKQYESLLEGDRAGAKTRSQLRALVWNVG